jgi:hypothetical protein
MARPVAALGRAQQHGRWCPLARCSNRRCHGTLLTFMMENPQNIGPSTTLLFVAKNLERIGDHATNIAEMVYFAATGDRLVDDAK